MIITLSILTISFLLQAPRIRVYLNQKQTNDGLQTWWCCPGKRAVCPGCLWWEDSGGLQLVFENHQGGSSQSMWRLQGPQVLQQHLPKRRLAERTSQERMQVLEVPESSISNSPTCQVWSIANNFFNCLYYNYFSALQISSWKDKQRNYLGTMWALYVYTEVTHSALLSSKLALTIMGIRLNCLKIAT